MVGEKENNNNLPEEEEHGTGMPPSESETDENRTDQAEGNEEKEQHHEKGKKWKNKIFSGKKKLLLLVIPALLILGGLRIQFVRDQIKNLFSEEDVIDFNLVNEDTLTEKVLRPFIIPLPPDSSGKAVRIDFSVIWDGLASVRFENRKHEVRSQLYQVFLDLGKNKGDLRTESEFLEKKMTSVFRELLHVQNLIISIKEIRYI